MQCGQGTPPLGPAGLFGSDVPVPSHDPQGRWVSTKHDPAEIPFQSSLREAAVSSSGTGKRCRVFDQSLSSGFALTLPTQHFPPLTTALATLHGAQKDDFERSSWRMSRPNHVSFRLLARWPVRIILFFCTPPLSASYPAPPQKKKKRALVIVCQ